MFLMERKRVCILVFSDIARDGRVLREVEYARRHYDVDVIAQGQWNPPEGVRFFSLRRTTWNVSLTAVALLLAGNLASGAWEKYYWQRREYWDALDLLRNGRYDLIHANDLDTLPVAVKAAEESNTRILYDAHEYSLDAGGESWRVRIRSPFRKYLLKTYGPKISAMITVADGIGNLYRSHFQFDSKVIMNAPYYREHEFRPVDPSRVNLVHHGGVIAGRNIEDFISMMPMLDDRFHLHLMLVPVYRSYHATLQHLAEKVAPHRIHFLTPVTPDKITDVVNRFDIGIPLMRVNKLSYFNALPNKFFEYITAGLAIAVSPLPEMERIVKEHKIGVISPDQSIDSMVKMLNGLSPDQINEFKRNSLSLAKTLNGDVEMQKLMDIYAGLLSA
jgi:glycosyltransferase involved in cell wall biosynthesis